VLATVLLFLFLYRQLHFADLTAARANAEDRRLSARRLRGMRPA
jgi:hypothetical protein